MLGADLAGEEDELLGAIAVVVLVDDDFDSVMRQVVHSEIGHFHGLALSRSDDDPGGRQHPGGLAAGPFGVFSFHGVSPGRL